MSTPKKQFRYYLAILVEKYSQIVIIPKSAFLQGSGPILSKPLSTEYKQNVQNHVCIVNIFTVSPVAKFHNDIIFLVRLCLYKTKNVSLPICSKIFKLGYILYR